MLHMEEVFFDFVFDKKYEEHNHRNYGERDQRKLGAEDQHGIYNARQQQHILNQRYNDVGVKVADFRGIVRRPGNQPAGGGPVQVRQRKPLDNRKDPDPQLMNQALSGFADNQRLEIGKNRTCRRNQQVEQGQPADGIKAAFHGSADQKMVDYALQQQRLNQQSAIDNDYAQTGENELEGVRGG
ncbi:hypothetical protein D3C73_1092090 [compost metagenome]